MIDFTHNSAPTIGRASGISMVATPYGWPAAAVTNTSTADDRDAVANATDRAKIGNNKLDGTRIDGRVSLAVRRQERDRVDWGRHRRPLNDNSRRLPYYSALIPPGIVEP